MNAVELCGITAGYGKEPLLCECSFNVPQGAFYGILGPASAGKTLLCRLIAGLEIPGEGDVFVCGRTAGGLDARRCVSFAPVSMDVRYAGTVQSLLAGMQKDSGEKPDYSRIRELCSEFGIEPGMCISRADVAERKCLAVAAALLRKSEVIVLDEPSLYLDTRKQAAVFRELKEACDDGKTVIFSTRSTNEILRYASGCAIIENGVLLREGAPDGLCELRTRTVTLQAHTGEGISSVPAERTVRRFWRGEPSQLCEALSDCSAERISIAFPTAEEVCMLCREEKREAEL